MLNFLTFRFVMLDRSLSRLFVTVPQLRTYFVEDVRKLLLPVNFLPFKKTNAKGFCLIFKCLRPLFTAVHANTLQEGSSRF